MIPCETTEKKLDGPNIVSNFFGLLVNPNEEYWGIVLANFGHIFDQITVLIVLDLCANHPLLPDLDQNFPNSAYGHPD